MPIFEHFPVRESENPGVETPQSIQKQQQQQQQQGVKMSSNRKKAALPEITAEVESDEIEIERNEFSEAEEEEQCRNLEGLLLSREANFESEKFEETNEPSSTTEKQYTRWDEFFSKSLYNYFSQVSHSVGKVLI